ncbi:Lectin-domain containing receptor kinase VI.4 [Carex littledalei]|uniref:Lectin-domain containing receptor kinase VI.4 n=1 Tax=Carex littledalei TaxID=544730 RepID=A0A833R8F7_9POAL|nr:Lectin-domain containing receptor kinase VI.4 [Carex littledalei]
MRGDSLDALIFRKGEYAADPPLPWKKRLEIAVKILEGIRYLQEEIEGETSVIHVDLKPENILMDEELNPYMADFGAAVTIEKGNINATTKKKKFLGTFGYMDPAIANNGSVTLGMDVFSFGSILLDLVMRRDLQPKKMEPMITLDYVSRIMDPSLIADQVPLEEVTEVVELVSRCRMEAREINQATGEQT